jgi:arginase
VALREAGLLTLLEEHGVTVTDHGDLPELRWRPDPENPRAANASQVAENARAVSERVRTIREAGQLPLVLGGDCTVGIGTLAGVRGDARVGLVYLDLHADMNVPESTVDGALDWMGVAHMLGMDDCVTEVRDVLGEPLQPENLLLFGFDPAFASAHERAQVSERGIAVVGVEELTVDPAAAARKAADALGGCDRLLVHFDVDVIDFLDAPLSENTERDGGTTQAQAMAALASLASDDRFAGLTVTELNPDHGAADGSTVRSFAAGLAGALGG